MSQSYSVTSDDFDAVLFDLDGVLTATAKVHAVSWKRMFDEFLSQRSKDNNEAFVPFEIDTDYKHYVDGKPRLEGVRSFLELRGIDLPEGNPDEASK
ncbi:MAG: hydrolase, partial [Cyanobacteria bacterium P01_C01_bin.38]